MAAVGMALDLAHLPAATALDAVESYAGPVLASHANAHAIYANPRNAGDELLAALGEHGGVCGLNALPVFLGPGDAHERLVAHHAHLTVVGGPGLPAIGADLLAMLPRGLSEAPELGLPPGSDRSLFDLAEPRRDRLYHELGAALAAAGRPPDEVAATLGGNALRVLRAALG
jgi:microsomal dipeptidase-like Zn-dependent dipeptidase